MKRAFLKVILSICILSLSLCGLSGCGEEPGKIPPAPTYSRTLRIGIIPEQDVFAQKKRYQPLADYVSHNLGINIELVMLPRYGNIINNFNGERLDGAFFGSFTCALALMRLQIVPLARPEWKDGSSTCFGMLFVRKDSAIHNGADMRGKSFAFVDQATTAGYLLPLHYFAEEGIGDYRAWFKEVYFAGTHEAVIEDVLNKRADIGAAQNRVFNRLALADKRVLDELEILATSPEVPANSLAVKSDLDQQTLTALKDCLLEMDRDPKGRAVLETFGAIRYIETTVSDFKPVFDYARHIDLDLTRYQY